MIVHPIFIPNKGIEWEIYLAEEAIGLAKSLGWNIIKGPFNKINSNEIIDEQNNNEINVVEFE